jgi:hypothetical protein
VSRRRLLGEAPDGASEGEDDRSLGEVAPGVATASPPPTGAKVRQLIAQPPAKRELGTALLAHAAKPQSSDAGKRLGKGVGIMVRFRVS